MVGVKEEDSDGEEWIGVKQEGGDCEAWTVNGGGGW